MPSVFITSLPVTQACHTDKFVSEKKSTKHEAAKKNSNGRGNITFQRDLRIGVCRSGTGTLAMASDTFCNFGVDTCASDHICDDMSKFSEIDVNKFKTFEVVNADDITSSGVGTVTLNVATTSGITKELVLKDVHYMPQQRMSLISVGKAMNSQGFESPDLKKLTWKVDRNCTMKLLKTCLVYTSDAADE